MMKENIYLSTIDTAAASLAREYGLGIEIAEYCTAWNMDREFSAVDPLVRESLKGISRSTLHGPYNELFPCAIDPKAKELAVHSFKLTSNSDPSYKTPFDWLTRDENEVQKYIDDPLCGFPFTAAGYRDMFSGLSRLYPEKLGCMEKDIPVYLFSGDKDPVGANGAGVERVGGEIRAAGVKDVSVKLYPEGRHEMFNEFNREEVWNDLAHWMEARI